MLILCVAWFSGSASAAEISLEPNCRTFYADHEHTFTISAKDAVGKELSWNMRYAGRTLAAGKQTIRNNGMVKIKIDFPELEDEVIVTAEFSCWLGKQALGKNRKDKSFIRKMTFFNPNPFEGKKAVLAKRQIGIWNAGDDNSLADLLTELEVPFAKVAAPEQFSGKVLLVSGLNLQKAPGALEACLKLANFGKKVIILPEISGKTKIPLAKLAGMKLGKNDLIKDQGGISKKLDKENWNGQAINQNSLKLQAAGENIELKVIDKSTGFTFCELSKSKGQVIFTTWDIVKRAKDSPTPVYLLKEMLMGGAGF